MGTTVGLIFLIDVFEQQARKMSLSTKALAAIASRHYAVVRDPAYLARIEPDLEAPDHIHLNPKGYQEVAQSAPLWLLDPKLPK